MSITIKMKHEGRVIERKIGKGAGPAEKEGQQQTISVPDAGWKGDKTSGGHNRSREILAMINSIMRAKVAREKELKARDYSMLAPAEQVKQRRAASIAGDAIDAQRLDALYNELEESRNQNASRLTKSKYPNMFSSNESDRALSAAERASGTQLAQMAGTMARATVTLKRLIADHRLEAAFALCEALDTRGDWKDTPSIADATAFTAVREKLEESTGVKYFAIGKTICDSTMAFVEKVTQVTPDGVALRCGPTEMVQLGLLSQQDAGAEAMGDPGETAPETLADDVRVSKRMDERIDQVNADYDEEIAAARAAEGGAE